MKKSKLLLIILLLLGLIQSLPAQDHKVYFCIIGRKIITVVGQDIVLNGLYIGEHGKNNWERYCWKNGNIFSIAPDSKTNGKNIFLACGNGVMKSTDYGKNWKIMTNWEVTEAQKVYIDPSNSQTLYLASSFGIWKSTDYGDTWAKKNNGLKLTSQTYCTGLIILPKSPNTLFAGTGNGVVMSKDGGETWQFSGLGGIEIHDIKLCPYDENIILCGTEDYGTYITKDGGKTWRQINMELKGRTMYAVSFDPINKGTIYCGGYLSGLNKSTNFGEKWVPLDNEISDKTIKAIAIHPENPSIIYTGSLNYGVWKSEDGGNLFKCTGECDARVYDVQIY